MHILFAGITSTTAEKSHYGEKVQNQVRGEATTAGWGGREGQGEGSALETEVAGGEGHIKNGPSGPS